MSVADDVVVMTVRVEAFDPDAVARMHLGSDCVFLADVVGEELSPGPWLRLSVPSHRVELWPYDSGSIAVREN